MKNQRVQPAFSQLSMKDDREEKTANKKAILPQSTIASHIITSPRSQTLASNIPNVNISTAFRRKLVKTEIYCGYKVRSTNMDITELKQTLGDQMCSLYKSASSFHHCLLCEEECVEGEFGVETILFLPNKNDPASDQLIRFRIELPRVSCYDCAQEYAQSNDREPAIVRSVGSLANVWKQYLNKEISHNNNQNNNASNSPEMPNNNNSISMNDNKSNVSLSSNNNNNLSNPMQMPIAVMETQNDDRRSQRTPNLMSPSMNNNNNNNMNMSNSSRGPRNAGNNMMGGVPNSNAYNNASSNADSERDPFDDGFLICTQLVKTGGADQGGLQVGDVFVEFGHYSKKRFTGLKSIANLVRRSAGKEICVVVWRKLEEMNTDDDGSGRTVFQKLALKLKPLQSHDADGGGVLGAVINTYPLPEMKN